MADIQNKDSPIRKQLQIIISKSESKSAVQLVRVQMCKSKSANKTKGSGQESKLRNAGRVIQIRKIKFKNALRMQGESVAVLHKS